MHQSDHSNHFQSFCCIPIQITMLNLPSPAWPRHKSPKIVHKHSDKIVLRVPQECMQEGLSVRMVKAQEDPLHYTIDKEIPANPQEKRPPSCLSIQATCRQIYLESCGIFYAHHTIYLANAQDMYHFLTSIGPNLRQHITSLHLAALTLRVRQYSKKEIDCMESARPMSEELRRYFEERSLTISDPDAVHARRLLRDCHGLRSIFIDVISGEEHAYIRWLVLSSELQQNAIHFETELHWNLSIERARRLGEQSWFLNFFDRQSSPNTCITFNHHELLRGKSVQRFRVDVFSPPHDLFDESKGL